MRHSNRIVLAACVVLVSGGAVLAAGRNVVLMIGDDHGLDAGCYGHPVIRTPGLDRLAAQGTRFTHGFAAVSSCSPSRSVLFTGMFNHTTGQYGLAHAKHNFYSFTNLPTLPKLLRDAGYRTALVGKYHVKPEGTYPFEILRSPGGGRNVAAMAEAAKAFMAEASNSPFLLVVGYVDPHRGGSGKGFGNEGTYPGIERVRYAPEDMVVPPFLPDTPEARAELAEYAESVSRMDTGINLMLDAIADSGRAEDTLVIYVSDNGIAFPGAKTTLYDPGIHLPLLIASPRQGSGGLVNRAMVSWVDIAPTILEWAGVEAPEQVAGRSLLPILEQEDPTGWDTVYASHTFHEVHQYYPMRMIRTREYKYILNPAHPLEFPLASDLWNSTTWQGILRRGDKRYGQRTVEALLNRPKEELYDLRSDPHETRNLVTESGSQAVLADLRQRLRDWQERTEDPWITKYERE
jgi:N-sulfoglucosamine sulfohydrolase